MPKPPLQPAALQARIHTIAIIRDLALLRILLVNFTVDVGAIEPLIGWPGIADQTIHLDH